MAGGLMQLIAYGAQDRHLVPQNKAKILEEILENVENISEIKQIINDTTEFLSGFKSELLNLIDKILDTPKYKKFTCNKLKYILIEYCRIIYDYDMIDVNETFKILIKINDLIFISRIEDEMCFDPSQLTDDARKMGYALGLGDHTYI